VVVYNVFPLFLTKKRYLFPIMSVYREVQFLPRHVREMYYDLTGGGEYTHVYYSYDEVIAMGLEEAITLINNHLEDGEVVIVSKILNKDVSKVVLSGEK
jgi:hypothetical protein